MKNQEEPADLSSPSRIRAFLLGLPPFQVKFEEDLNGTRFGKFLPPASLAEPPRMEAERGEAGGEQEEVTETERSKPEEDLKRAGPSDTDSHCV